MPRESAIEDHQKWLGYLQPDGLVVSPAALVDSQVLMDRNTLPLQERFLPLVGTIELDQKEILAIENLPAFFRDFLEWPDECVFGPNDERPLPDSLSLPLPEYGLTVSPTLAFKDVRGGPENNPWILLVQSLAIGTDLDKQQPDENDDWKASHSLRFERLLREVKVPIGLLSNGSHLRLIYAPHGENSGSLTFSVSAMSEVQGRPILAALHLLLDQVRLLSAPTDARLPALLSRSREYQSRVSAALAQQVLDSLYELLRGLQHADERTKGELLRNVLAENPDDVYRAMLTVLMRLVFLLFAEDRGLMPTSELYVQNYSVHGLFERLRTDNENFPDTMDQRFGAWARLIAAFRMVYQGSRHERLRMPARHGHLFDPTRYPFLEGRTTAGERLPLISDGTIYRILEKLLILGGERLSYRTLDVEEIGSVYQTVMGFRLEIATGPSIAIQGKKKHKSEVAPPTVVDLHQLLRVPGKDRVKALKERTNQELSGEAEKILKVANNADDLLVALEKKIARNATPGPVAVGAMVIQPTDERRRSGSHYTPRAFTEPIVRKTLAPILNQLGEQRTPEQILDLKICDLAVGSGAFLVETCRQLGDALVKAWQHYGERPVIPPDETEDLFARRLVAQRCLHGVDRNPMAVDLAKLSLWLATLAREHPFTFLDHSIRVGDALVGLTRQQIADFHWLAEKKRAFGQETIESRIRTAGNYRKRILEGGDFVTPQKKHEDLERADEALEEPRFVGNMVIAAFFSATKDKARKAVREDLLNRYLAAPRNNDYTVGVEEIRNLTSGVHPVTPFHWEIEFPEVFDRENPGFDAVVGNPPYAGKNNLINGNRAGYLDWLKALHAESHGNADLVAQFFRRAFNLLRRNGTFGLIATNTIRQGDTRQTGLRWICAKGGGTIYAARRRYKWAGAAAVIVSVVWVAKGAISPPYELDDKPVAMITAYLFHDGGHENPSVLTANADKSFQGSIVLGMGFTFDDTDKKGVANSLAEMERLIAKDPRNAERIFPYLGGEEVNDSPTHAHHRYVINFADFPLRREELEGKSWLDADEKQRNAWLRTGIVPDDYPEPVAADWPELLEIVKSKVKPERDKDSREIRRKYWWRHGELAKAFYRAASVQARILAISYVTAQFGITFLPTGKVFAMTLTLFPLDSWHAFALLQCRVHETWARFFASSLEDRLRYTPSDCFETFPLPVAWETNSLLEEAGREYYEVRAALMQQHNEGLTATYNRFHDPDECNSEILRLRGLHDVMDRAVLAAYGWSDLAAKAHCEFHLDYEDEGDEEDSGRRKRKKPWRYRWPDEIRDQVLTRLLELNVERAKEERAENPSTKKANTRKPAPGIETSPDQQRLAI